MSNKGVKLVCHGCGASPPKDEPYPFRCPKTDSEDGADHVLSIELDTEGDVFPRTGDSISFVAYRDLLYSYRVARARGMSDAEFVQLVEDVDSSIHVLGPGLEVTPCATQPDLAEACGGGEIFVKDETNGFGEATHKGRHLAGIAIYLEMARRTGLLPEGTEPGLAISSCGNAALAAAIIVGAMDRDLDVYVPTWADEALIKSLKALHVNVVFCERESEQPGDPCTHAFRSAVAGGALPFSCQGTDNALAIDGGRTLGFELVNQVGGALDALFIQVGGGALASSTVQALRIAMALGAIKKMPRIHAVQVEGGHPLERAWRRVTWEIDKRMSRGGQPSPDGSSDAELAQWLLENVDSPECRSALAFAAQNRREFMWPWEEPPKSAATGILDDETYDWFEIVRAMIQSGGWPIVVSEEELRRANDIAGKTTGIEVSVTGSAGLAGLLHLGPHEGSSAVLFTGGKGR